MVILTLTRIFLLTHGQQSLVRSITTPLLPGFISTCLNLLTRRGSKQHERKPSFTGPLHQIVLSALIKLLPNHSSSFRPFVGQIRSLVAPLLAPTPSNELKDGVKDSKFCAPSQSTVALAQTLFSLLPHCTPKNTCSDEWSRFTNVIISHGHGVADRLFRAVKEDRPPRRKRAEELLGLKPFGESSAETIDDELDLPAWNGVHAGAERLTGVFELLQSQILTSSSGAISIPVGSICGLMERILFVFGPIEHSREAVEVQPILNPEITKGEKDQLWSCLPGLHAAAIDVLKTLLGSLGPTSVTIWSDVLEQPLWIFAREQNHAAIRASTYCLVKALIKRLGASLPEATAHSITLVIRSACNDILPASFDETGTKATVNGENKGSNKQASENADSYVAQLKDDSSKALTKVQILATELIQAALEQLPSECFPVYLRQQLDRTAILTQNKGAMFASIMNQPSHEDKNDVAVSIMPFLARQKPRSLDVEALLRPRMPLFRGKRRDTGDMEVEDEESGQVLMHSGLIYHNQNPNSRHPDEFALKHARSSSFPPEQSPRRPQGEIEGRRTQEAVQIRPSVTNEDSAVELPKRPLEAEVQSIPVQETEGPPLKKHRGDHKDVERPATADNSGAQAKDHDRPLRPSSPLAPPIPPVTTSSSINLGNSKQDEGESESDTSEIPPIIVDSDSDDEEEEWEEEEQEKEEEGDDKSIPGA